MVSGVFFFRIGTGFFAFSGLRFACGLALAGGLSLFVLGIIDNFLQWSYESFSKSAKYHRLKWNSAIVYTGFSDANIALPLYPSNWYRFMFAQNIRYWILILQWIMSLLKLIYDYVQ
jgi:hypothetical protein